MNAAGGLSVSLYPIPCITSIISIMPDVCLQTLSVRGYLTVKGSRKKGLFFSGPATKAAPPWSIVATTFFGFFFLSLKRGIFS